MKLAYFTSARGTGSRNLFQTTMSAIKSGYLNAEIVCVVCNREQGQSAFTDAFFNEVQRHNIPLITQSSLHWRKRVRGEITQNPTRAHCVLEKRIRRRDTQKNCSLHARHRASGWVYARAHRATCERLARFQPAPRVAKGSNRHIPRGHPLAHTCRRNKKRNPNAEGYS